MDWKIVQCCESGKKHESSVCQDSCFMLEDAQYRVMALCDGTSDAEFSDLGSKWVAEFTARYFKKHFDSLYNMGFAKVCEVLTEYHQQLLMYLSECATTEKGSSIVVDRKINNQELRRYCTTVQVFAVKNGKAVYYKVGNGAAIIVDKYGTDILSDSSTESPTKHVTLPNTLSVLGCSDFQCFELNDEDYCDVILMTDGVEFSKGLFYNHEIKPEFDKLIELTKSILFTNIELRDFILQLRNSPYNTVQDDIGISILHNTSIWFKKEYKGTESTNSNAIPIVDSENNNCTTYTDMSGFDNMTISADTEKSDKPSLTVGTVMNDGLTSGKKKNNSAQEIQISTIDMSKASEVEEKEEDFDESDDTIEPEVDIAQPNKNKVKKTIRGNISRERQFLRKIVVHLLITFIAGTFLGGVSSTLMNSKKVEALGKKIDQLSEDIEALSDLIESSTENKLAEEAQFFSR